MATYNGDALVIYWKRHDGTATLSGVQRELTFNSTMDYADHTGGTADYRRRKKTVGDYDAQVVTLWDTTALGTASMALLALGNEGTLEFAPLGTASGNPKGAYPMVVETRELPVPFDDGIVVTIGFLANGDPGSDVFTAQYS